MFLLALPFIGLLTLAIVKIINPLIQWLGEMLNSVVGSARFATALVAYVPREVGQIFLAMAVFAVLCCIFNRIK